MSASKIDQFESAFKAASKVVFDFKSVTMRKALVVTDLSPYEARLFGDRVRKFLTVLGDEVEWKDISGDRCQSIGELLDLVEEEKPDLICTYRHLHSGSWEWPYGLGEHLDVLTQVTTTPVLVLPRHNQTEDLEKIEDTNSVMAITSELTGDHRLVSIAVRFTEKNGTLYLTHIENQVTIERFFDIISKIPSIDTEGARVEIQKQLLKEASDYIDSCEREIKAEDIPLSVKKIVTAGHHLSDYKELVAKHQVDLLIFNTKDEDQLAMHGLAYPLAVELRELPLLML